MGEAAVEARREVTEAREQLGDTLGELRVRGTRGRDRLLRLVPYALAGAGAVAGAVTAALIVRRRRGGTLTAAARRLPAPARGTAVPAARRTERWADRRAARVRRQREELVELIGERVAEQQARAERKANPVWRRTTVKALEAAASAGGAALAKEAVGRSMGAAPVRAQERADADLVGTRDDALAGAGAL